jgi:hypothetical protein
MCFRDCPPRQFVNPLTFCAWVLALNDGRNFRATEIVDAVMQLAPLCFRHFRGLPLLVTDSAIGNGVTLGDGLAKLGLAVVIGFCQ